MLKSLLFLTSFAFGLQLEPNPPTFPSNVYVFTPGNDAQIQQTISTVYAQNGGQSPPNNGQFSDKRFAFLFKPGTYNVRVDVGFYTGVNGMGEAPTDVVIRDVVVQNGDFQYTVGALDNFWRYAEGFVTNPTLSWNGGVTAMLWAVSQSSPLRRVQVNGNLELFQYNSGQYAGYASGGYLSDLTVTGQVRSGSQQQFYFRNSKFGKWVGGVWNMVFNGVQGAPPSHCGDTGGQVPITNVPTTPLIAEKPYIVYSGGKYYLKVPPLKVNSAGPTTDWTAGQKVDFSQVYVATEASSIDVINQKLAQGLHVVLCPGNYNFSSPIMITKSNTVVLGIGVPVLTPTNGNIVIQVSDGLDGVRIAGLLLQAGKGKSPALLMWGSPGNKYAGNAANPGFIYDVFARVGGTNNQNIYQVSAETMFRINSGYVVIDDTWLWRADHGVGGPVSKSMNPVQHGLQYFGDNGIAYGLASEHTLGDMVQWYGNNGKVYFFQSELPYDVTQAQWGTPGYVGYRVMSNVTNHEGYGLGVYCYFRDYSVIATTGISCPQTSGVKFTNSLAVFLNGNGQMSHVIDTAGDPVASNAQVAYVCSFGG